VATIRKEISLANAPDRVWDAVRDTGAIHTRFSPGFVTNTVLENNGASRMVTFGNGLQARERILSVDDGLKRIAYSVEPNARLTHHSASFQVIPEGAGCRLVWIADLLPNEMADAVGGMMEQGIAAAKIALEKAQKKED
jgi:hypothetical protein